MSDDAHQGDIIIVKRGGGAHDDHHGGVWKIAFADFMTAMMAFFLVMWLINASDEETKKTVASYFNPIELMDITTNPKGLLDPKYGVKKLPVDNPESNKKSISEITSDAQNNHGGYYDEEALFKDPIAMLSEIAGGIPQKTNEDGKAESSNEDGANNLALSGGERFQDPFDPASWQNQFGLESDTSGEGSVKEEEFDETVILNVDDNSGLVPLEGGFKEFEMNAEVPDDEAALRPQLNPESDQPEATRPGDLSPKNKSGEAGIQMAESEASHEAGIKMAETMDEAEKSMAELEVGSEGKLVDAEGRLLDDVATATNRELKENEQSQNDKMMSEDDKSLNDAVDQINEALAKNPDSNLKIEFVSKDGGSLITLSERASSGMFNIGSAKPTPQMVKIMAEIGRVIAKTDGLVTVSGHTDGRQYKSRDYNNWRLSTDRAHMAYFMLINGGVPETSFEKIEGFADTKLIVSDDPNAAENRRIEVFIRKI